MRAFFSQSMGQQLGLNVAVQTVQDPVAIARMKREVARVPGVKSRDFGAVANGAQLVSVDGNDATATLHSLRATDRITPDELSTIASDMQGVEGRDLRVARYHWTTVHGRNLDARDVGTDHMVVIADLQHLGVRVGSHLVFRDGGRAVSFTVVGIADSNSPTMFGSNQVDLRSMQRLGLTTRSSSHFSVAYLDIEPGMLRADLRTLRQHLRGDLVLDLSNFTVLINKTIDKLALFPEIIGALALFAGVIIIANTVALAMLERRREIGVMKAVGARRRTILQFLLVENAIVGFLGAAVGVGLAMVATAIADTQLLKISASFDLLTVLGLIVLGVILAMGASLLTALPASSEKPMSVLRYE
jgi:ABC-type antimicrobial peptide transport system permease subunit